VRVLLFSVGDELFAAPLIAIAESVDHPRVLPVPGADNHARGVIDLRGRRIAAYSPAAALNVDLAGEPGAALLLEGDGDETPIALLVSDVDDVVDFDEAGVRAAPGPADPDGILRGVIQLGGRLVSLVEPAAIREACLAVKARS
jgi:purine-binding chemotaxis protein CheW